MSRFRRLLPRPRESLWNRSGGTKSPSLYVYLRQYDDLCAIAVDFGKLRFRDRFLREILRESDSLDIVIETAHW